MPHLRLIQNARVAGTRHVRAGVVGFGIPNLAPGVFNDGLAGRTGGVAYTTNLAVVVEARTNRAERDFFLADLVAVVAVAAVGLPCGITPGEAAPALRDAFTFAPVANELAIRRPLDGFEIGLFNGFANFLVDGFAGDVGGTAFPVGVVLHQAVKFHWAFVAERVFDDPGGERIEFNRAWRRRAACY